MTRPQITIVGAGGTGATLAHWLAVKELGDIVLVDVVEGLPQGRALDLQQAAPIEGFDVRIVGTNDYADTRDSHYIVVTAGSPRKPGMSRADLLSTNARIVQTVVGAAVAHSPDAVLVMLTNPLDVMCYVALQASGYPKERVIGQSGILDSTRFRTFIAQALDVSMADVHAMVLGGHGDSMVPLVSHANAGGVPITRLLAPETIDELVERTRNGGAEIVGHLKTGSAIYAPGAAMAQMLEAMIRDRRRILPCAAYLEGEYGQQGVFAGVPVILGAGGIHEIIELELTDEEAAAFRRSAAGVREAQATLDELGGDGR